jgi:hypothetical protein
MFNYVKIDIKEYNDYLYKLKNLSVVIIIIIIKRIFKKAITTKWIFKIKMKIYRNNKYYNKNSIHIKIRYYNV